LEEACSILNLSAPSIYQLTHAKKLPHMKFGSKLVFSRRQLLQYREERTVNAVAEDEAFLLNNLSKSALKKLKNAEIKGAS
jgi:excisionase family DNA binding protein